MFDYLIEAVKIIEKEYPGLNILQLGFITLYLGYLRYHLGHENARSTLRDYIHQECFSDDTKLCIDFMEREIFALTKSRLDIDSYKIGNKATCRPDSKYIQEKEDDKR